MRTQYGSSHDLSHGSDWIHVITIVRALLVPSHVALLGD